MTIKEIAKESGYGVGTVSRVLNHSKNVSETARQRIMEVVEKHHFQPNANAKHLKQQTQFGIAIIIKGTQNMLLTSIVEKMQTQIEIQGYPSMIYYIDELEDEVEEAELILRERKPYAFVFMGSSVENEKRMEALEIPCLVMTTNASSLNIANVSSISIDDTAATKCMIDYLYEQGHEKIAMIGGSYHEDSSPTNLRLLGCQSAFFQHGLPFDRHKQYACARYSLKGGYQATVELMERYPEMTVIFAMSDLMAIGAIRALYDHGKRVPDDISVVGFDGIELADYMNPTLTTIRQNTERFAKRGAEILIRVIDEHSDAVHEIIPFELKLGKSVKQLSKA